MTEIEKVKSEIKVLEKKLALLEEMEKYRSPAEEAYKECYGEYPSGSPSEDARWDAFLNGYQATQPKAVPVDEPEDKYQKYGGTSYFTDDVIGSVLKKWESSPPAFMSFYMGTTLEKLIERWWCDVFGGINSDLTMEGAIADLCDRVEKWFPAEQSAEGSQDTYAIVAVDAENALLQKIKSKLRNKNV